MRRRLAYIFYYRITELATKNFGFSEKNSLYNRGNYGIMKYVAAGRHYGLVAQLGAHAVQLYAPSFGPVAHMAPIRFASPFIKTSYHHIFGPVTHLAVNRDRYMGP